MPVPMITGPRRVSIPLSDEEHIELFEAARRTRTSVSSLGHLAISQLLIQIRAGAIPMLPPTPIEELSESHR